MKKKITCNI